MPGSSQAQAKLLHELIASGRRYDVPKGQIVQTSENRQVLNLVKKGFIKRYLISNDGSLGVQAVYGPGYVFPLTLVFKTLFNQSVYEGPETIYYEAMSDSEIFTIDHSTLKESVLENPMLYRDLLSEAGVRLHSNIQKLENLSLRSSYKRVAHQLSYYGRQFGIKESDGTHLLIHLTHQDLADILSLTRETVSTSIIKLRKKGLIKTGKEMVIPKIEALEKEAYG